MKNNIHGDTCDHHVVYQYKCSEPGCGPAQNYIGYTTTSTKQRATTHAQTGSIRKHHEAQHGEKIKAKLIQERMSILFRSSIKTELTIAEALYIKTEAPPLNNQREGDTRILKIF